MLKLNMFNSVWLLYLHDSWLFKILQLDLLLSLKHDVEQAVKRNQVLKNDIGKMYSNIRMSVYQFQFSFRNEK